MYGKVFIILLSFIAFVHGGQNCPDEPNGAAAIDCQRLPGCDDDDGVLLPIATQCSNQLSDADCDQLFPCTSAGVACTRPGAAAGGDDTNYPFVRSQACLSPDLRNIALQCAKTCAMCCESPEFNCDDDSSSPVDCELNKGKCKDTDWTDIMSQYCPKTCGLCTSGTCTDINSGCNTMTALCKHVDWIDYMTTNCARTCDYCTTSPSSPGSSCSDIATNCAPNANLCTNTIYRELMQEQCCATCSGASGGGTSCSDSDSNCSNWVRNGFCSNSFYTTAQKRQYCGRSCNLC